MKIGILQTGLVPEEMAADHGQYSDIFARFLEHHDFTHETWSVVSGDFPENADTCDGWLITGSRHGAYEDWPWIPPLETLIRDIIAAKRPLIGVCFGHQIIAQALGGTVVQFDQGFATGPQVYDFPTGQKTIHAWHGDQVISPPEGAETIARNDFCAHAALLYPGKAFTIQPHPEFEDGFIHGLLDHRASGTIPPEQIAQTRANMGTTLDSSDILTQMARFYREGQIA